MKITFGLHLDGSAPTAPATLDELRCGPAGLLQWLEARLGLARRWPAAVERITAYEQALAAAGAGSFYERSFAKDPLAVAEALLAWRDELILSGWNRAPLQSGAARPDVLFNLESRVDSVVRTGVGDRVLEVLAALAERPIMLESLVVVDDRAHLPRLWLRLLAVLGAEWRAPGAPARFVAEEGTDLAAVQAVVAGRFSGGKFALRGDGSFTLYSAFSEITLGRIAGQELERVRRAGGRAVLLADAAAAQVDIGLAAVDGPTAGLEERSRARAIPQVLALALRLRWQPLDPQHLLEFLTHPVCPVDGWLRRELAEALQNAPGIGGPAWIEAIEAAREKVRECFAADLGERDRQLARMAADLEDWIMVERFALTGVAAGPQLAVTCSRVAAWSAAVAAHRVGRPDEGLYHALASAAQQLGVLLAARAEVAPVLLDRLLAEVLGAGWLAGTEPAELGGPVVLRHPGAVCEAVETLVWWGAAEPARARTAPWTNMELQGLAQAGITPLSATQLLDRESRAWERMILATRCRIVLLLPRQRGGESAARHPLLNRLQGLLGKTPLPLLDADARLRAAASPPGVSFAPAPELNLPARVRWWRLADGCTLPPRAEESFSSAEKFLYRPYHWVLQYPARLRRGVLNQQQLHSTPRLHGNLLHRLTEWLFNAPPPAGLDWRHATPADVRDWVGGRWQRLLETEGAPLLVPGRLTENARLRADAVRSLGELLRILRAANVVTAVADMRPAAQPFCGGTISGRLDLVATNQAGREAVLDLKYGGGADKYRQLRAGIPLQLAVYAFLLAEGGRRAWPAAAFFMLKNCELLTRDPDFFPGPAGGNGAAGKFSFENCWREFEELWRWRRRLLDERWIEVTVRGTKPTTDGDGVPSSAAPLAHWQPGKDHNKYNDFVALTGFGGEE